MQRKIVNFILLFILALFISQGYCLNLDKVKFYFLSGNYENSIKEGEKVLAAAVSDSDDLDELYYILGLSYLKDGNYLRASDVFEIIIKEFKDSSFQDEAVIGLADTYFLRGDFIKAEELYKEALGRNPDTKFKAQLFYRLSEVALKQGDSDKARVYLDKLKDFPLNPETKFNLDSPITLKSNTEGLYYAVQVGSFSNQINAKNLAQKLTAKGYPAYIEEAPPGHAERSYRVRVGKFSLRQEALDLEKRLSREGYPTKIYP